MSNGNAPQLVISNLNNTKIVSLIIKKMFRYIISSYACFKRKKSLIDIFLCLIFLYSLSSITVHGLKSNSSLYAAVFKL